MGFTCIACLLVFKDPEIQKQHYKTDWHRYNLKRKVAELPPVTAEEFQQRVLEHRAETEKALPVSTYCKPCKKSFSTQKSHTNHLSSKKHKENEKNYREDELEQNKEDVMDTDSEVDEVDSDEWDEDVDNPIENNDCLFCSHHSRNLTMNVKHMTLAHSFFIPDTEYCIDIKGLLLYLGEKIKCSYMCIWCNEKGRTFHSADAARTHMIDKGHCKMLHEGETLAEYAPFYDYSPSYPDNDDGIDTNTEVIIPEIDDSDYQLTLPSGAVIGHRSLMRYYKQSIDPKRAVVVPRNQKKLHSVLAAYRALGWTDTDQKAAARRARDLHHMKRLQSKYNMQMGCKANKFQTHFRAQVMF